MSNGNLLKDLFSKNHLKEHFYEKIKYRSAVGLDNITVAKFEENIDNELSIIERKVCSGTYTFTRYRQVLISKGANNNPRVISIPTTRDKLVASVLNEIIVTVFGQYSKSLLPQTIISSILNELDNYSFFIKIDISKFYSSIKHDKAMRTIRRKIRKREILSLIYSAITTETISVPIKEKRMPQKSRVGVPEGLPISNSIANIYMMDVDNKYINNDRIKYFRYVDDILILANERDFDPIKKSIQSDIKKLGLEVNKDKIASGSVDSIFSYLGYDICRTTVGVRKATIYKLEASIEDLIKSCKNKSLALLKWKLNLKITGFILDNNKYGWVFFYSQITDTSVLHHLDWVVDRLLKRYKLDQAITPKKYVRTYHEIVKNLHNTKYIPNFDELSMENKKQLVEEIYERKIEGLSDPQIDYLFKKLIRREIRDVEKDVEQFS